MKCNEVFVFVTAPHQIQRIPPATIEPLAQEIPESKILEPK